ncbi:hypothetical protein BT69DRAFT_1200115, partial [Atractiella rhizophila]
VQNQLCPLAIAANVAQGDSSCLYTILLMLGQLFNHYFDPTTSIPPSLQRALLTSLEKRWNRADQLIFIFDVVLHPALRTEAFS